jgi:hypothetical protein
MARRPAISFKNVSPRIMGALAEYRPARIQRFDIKGNFPSTDVQEHGNQEYAGSTTEIPDYTVTLSALDVSIKLFSALTGTSAAAYPGTGVSINALDTVDIIGDVKDEVLMDYVKVIHVRKCRPQSLKFAYSVDGQATEEYTFGASTKTLFTHDVVVDVLSAASSPATTSETPEQLKSGNYIISAMLDGVYLTETTGTPATGEYAVTGTSVSFADTGTTLVVAYKANPSGTNWSWVSDTAIPAAISGKDIPIYIYAEDPASDISIPRVQSVNISVNLKADPIKEMGNTEIVDYVAQIPEVTGDITVLDTDEEFVQLFSTGDVVGADTEYRTCDLLTGRNLNLKIRLRDPSDPCSTSGVVLKTVYVPDLILTGESYTSNVGDNMTSTFNFKSSTGNLVIYSGSY